MRRQWFLGMLIGWGALLPRLHAQAPSSMRVGEPQAATPLLRIGLIADAQYCDCDASHERYYRISLEKLHQAVDTFNAQGVDLVVNLGDLIDQKLQSFSPAMRALDRLEMPVEHVLGNHEFWDVPFGMQPSILDTLHLANGYCELLLPGWRLLMLDGTELAEYAQGMHRDLADEAEACRSSLLGHQNGAIWNGAIGREQMAWMEWHLSQAEAAGERVVLFCHFPISPPGHSMTLWNEADLRVMLSRYHSADAWIAGHSHFGSYEYLDSIHHLTLRGMLMSPDSNAFAILNLYPDRMEVEGFGREPYRVMPLRGSNVSPDTRYPANNLPPDALPKKEIPCVDRRVLNPMGATVFSEETDSLNALKSPPIRTGFYEIISVSQGKYSFGRIAMMPK